MRFVPLQAFAILFVAVGVLTSTGLSQSASLPAKASILSVRNYRVAHEKQIVKDLVRFLSIPNTANSPEEKA